MKNGYQAIIPLINLATQLIQFKQIDNNGFIGLQIDFDVKFNRFINSFREEVSMVHETYQITLKDIFEGEEQIRNDFLFVNNEILRSFEEIKIEVKDRRANKAMLFEIQLLG
jgi:hypothetical protein